MRWVRERFDSGPRLADAFPSELRNDVSVAIKAMPPEDIHAMHGFSVLVRGELVHIPYRIYNPEPEQGALADLSRQQMEILSCLYTRHHDGRVRERTVRPLLESDADWIVPFVVQLIGEYVVEIIEVINDGLTQKADLGSYERFAAENRDFLELTKQHAISYWNCYYRSKYPRVNDYPGRVAIARILGHRREQRTSTDAPESAS